MRLEEISPSHQALFSIFLAELEVSDRESLFGVAESEAKGLISVLQKERMDWRPKAGQTSITHYALIVADAMVGYGRLRFPIETEGDRGNLEFFVPPSFRGRGFGTHTLNKLLFEAVRAGLARALVVCRIDDFAAIRCIESNRGERIENDSGGWARFWIRFR